MGGLLELIIIFISSTREVIKLFACLVVKALASWVNNNSDNKNDDDTNETNLMPPGHIWTHIEPILAQFGLGPKLNDFRCQCGIRYL